MKNTTIVLFNLIVLSFLGFANVCSAATIFTDNFNSESTGDLINQAGWVADSTHDPAVLFTVENSVVNEGLGALAITGASPNDGGIYRMGTERTDGTMTFYFMATDINNSRAFISITSDTSGASFGANINQSNPGYVAYSSSPGYSTSPDLVDTAGVWHYVQMQWRSLDHTVRYNVDGGVWTNFESVNGWNSGGFDKIIIAGNCLGKDTLYIDTIRENTIAETKTPVLIVPGLMGTEIFNGSEKLWPDELRMIGDITDSFMDPLILGKDLMPNSINASPGDILRQEFGFNYTSGLLAEFKNQGYAENETLFTFPYDWRYGASGKYPDGKTNADLLAEKIQDILAQTGSDTVNVVAHSEGGLIVKKYVVDHAADHHIGKAVFVGVPSTGAPKAVKVLLQGDNFGIPFLSPDEMKKISENLPVAYDLSPSQQYYDTKGSFVKVIDEGTIGDLNSHSNKDLNYQDFESFLIGTHRLNSQALIGAENLHTKDFDNVDLRTAGVDVYSIDGCKTGTIGKIVEDRYKNIFGQNFVDYKRPKFTPGDGTVPLESATNLPISDSNKFYLLQADHSKMLSQDGSRQEIVNLLTGSSLSVNSKFITQDIGVCKLNGKAISVFSPVDILVTDQEGNRLGTANDESVVSEIPGADIEVFGDHKFLYLPTDDSQKYTVKIKGTGAGTFTISSQDIVNNEVTGTEVFSNLAVTPNLSGQINFGNTGEPTTLVLKQTPNDADQIILASASVNAAQSEDFLPPVSMAAVNGQKDSNGNYAGDVPVTIKATDENSGILSIAYNLDNAGFQKVTGDSADIAISSEGDHVVSFFSTDNAGNNEVAQQVQVTIKKPVVSLPESSPGSVLNNPPIGQSAAGGGGGGLLLIQGQPVNSTDKNISVQPQILTQNTPVSISTPPKTVAIKNPRRILATVKIQHSIKPLASITPIPTSATGNNSPIPLRQTTNPFLASLSSFTNWIMKLFGR